MMRFAILTHEAPSFALGCATMARTLWPAFAPQEDVETHRKFAKISCRAKAYRDEALPRARAARMLTCCTGEVA